MADLIYDFEDGTLQGWVDDSGNFEVKTDRTRGSYSAGNTNNNECLNIAHVSPDELNGGGECDYIEFYFNEDYSSNGGGMAIEDSNGNEIIGVATSNPDWGIHDNSGWNQVYGGDGYGRWIYVKITFDWENGEADVYMEDLNSGYSDTYSNRPLINNTDVETLRIKNLRKFSNGWEDGNDFHMWFDDIKISGVEVTEELIAAPLRSESKLIAVLVPDYTITAAPFRSESKMRARTETLWVHYLNGVYGENIKTLFGGNVDMINAGKINGVG